MAAGFYRDIELTEGSTEQDNLQKKISELEGVKSTGGDYLHTILEMHVDLNLVKYYLYTETTNQVI